MNTRERETFMKIEFKHIHSKKKLKGPIEKKAKIVTAEDKNANKLILPKTYIF